MSKIVKITVFVFLVLALTTGAIAYDKKHGPSESGLAANAYLTILLPTLPDAPSFTAKALDIRIAYQIEGRGLASIRGEDLPTLVYEADEAFGKLNELTVIVEGIPGTVSELNWQSFPEIIFSPLDLRVKAYDKMKEDIRDGDKPIVDIILSDLKLSTKPITIEGYSTTGYLDAEKLEAQLVFSTELPEAEYALYSEWLEGQPILGELRVRLDNPFN